MTEKKSDKLNDKSIRISADRHREIKLMAVKEDREMRDVINEAFDIYKQYKEEYNIK